MVNRWFYEVPFLGRCGIETDDAHIVRVLLGQEAAGDCAGKETLLSREAARQLTEYAAGERQQFDLPLFPVGTPFQQRVWALLRQIPWGESCTYGQLAARLGMPGASRAVGNAVGANPIPILIPCHRVLAAGERLGGFRLGAELKRELLRLEGISCPDRKTEKI